MKKIISIIGARPQFIKHAPIELASKGILDMVTVHTGQHYDHKMSQIFFEELKISTPKYNLQAGSGTHGVQTGKMLIDLEPILIKEKPDAVLVFGDTNSTLAGALCASKLHMPVIHVEAGLRSFNREMPEEINRVLTDHVSSLLFVPTKTGIENLKNEGITKNVILIGDVMYDMIKVAEAKGILTKDEDYGQFYYATIHRPYNTDKVERIGSLLNVFNSLPLKVKFSIHPRTFKIISSNFNVADFPNIEFLEPLSYFDSIKTIFNSSLVITDSGGLQKEAYMMKKKCITVRTETEWVETLQNNWNNLVFDDLSQIIELISQPTGPYIEGLYGAGDASAQIVQEIDKLI